MINETMQEKASESQKSNHKYIADQIAKRPARANTNLVVNNGAFEEVNLLRRRMFGPEFIFSQEEGRQPNPSWGKARRQTVLSLPEVEKALDEMRQYFAKALAGTELEMRKIEQEDARLQGESVQSEDRASTLRDGATAAVLNDEAGAKKMMEAAELESLKQSAIVRKRASLTEELKKVLGRHKATEADAVYGEWCLWEHERRRLAQEMHDAVMLLHDISEAYKTVMKAAGPLRAQYTKYDANGGIYSMYAYTPPEMPDEDNDQDGKQT